MSESVLKILNLVLKNVKDPFYIIGADGAIHQFNSNGKKLLKFEEIPGNILSYFNEETTKQIQKTIEEAIEQNEYIPFSFIRLIFKDGREINSDISFTPFEIENQQFLFCTIIPKSFSYAFTGISSFAVDTGSIDEVVKSEKIKTILNRIKNLYPLTLIGKETIHKYVDELDEPFWLRDNKGKYLIVNTSFAFRTGLKVYQIEGKDYGDFIPAYLKNLYTAIDEYVKETLNCIILSGSPFSRREEDEDKEFLEIPLTDNQNNVVARIGFLRKKLISNLQQKSAREIFKLEKVINQIPVPFAFIDNAGRFKQSSKEFIKLFIRKFNDLTGLKYSEVFTRELSEAIANFVNSANDGIIIELTADLEVSKESVGEYKLYLTKIYDENNHTDAISVLLEKVNFINSIPQLLKSKGRMFEQLIKNNPNPIFIYDKENLRFLEVNDATLQLYGYTHDEFLQMDLTDLYTPEDIQTLLDTSDEAMMEGKFGKTFRHRKKDGSTVYVQMSKSTFKFNDRDAVINIIKDVSHDLQQEKETTLLKAAIDNSSDMIFITDSTGIIKSVNYAASKNLGCNKSEMIDTSLASYCTEESRTDLISTVFQADPKDAVNTTVTFKKDSGETFVADVIATPSLNMDEEVESFSITAKTAAAGETKEIVKEVIKEVVVEKPAPQQSGKSLDASFLSGVFHEILTPMNVILGFSQELTESIETLSPEQKEAIDIINQNRVSLLNLMNSIIEFSESEIKRSELEIGEISITEIIDYLEKNIGDIAGKQDLEFAYGKISSSLKFRSDKKKFESLTNNLIRLISRQIPENKIYFSAYVAENNNFNIVISDKYGSISENLENLLKQLFIDEVDAKELGVSKLTAQISKSLLNVLGGKYISSQISEDKTESAFQFPVNLSTESEPGQIAEPEEETTVTEETEMIMDEEQIEIEEEELEKEPEDLMTMQSTTAEEFSEEMKTAPEMETPPVEEEITLEEEEPLTDEINLSSLSCLYIEDQVDSQILFKVQMKGLKDIKFASSFEESLPLLESQDFDFIVMDINLQGEYNGLDALKIIHNMAGLEEIPVIAVTAYVLPGDKEKFIATGFNDFISKPIFREKMIESLKKIFVK